MEVRIVALESFAVETRDRLTRIETRLDTFATKEDLQRELHTMTWKLVGVATCLVAVVYWVARSVH